MTSTVQNTTLSQGEVRLRWTAPLPPHPLDAEPRSRDTRVEVFPCGSDLEQEVIADMVESGEWDFDGPIPHWHDTRPVCLKVTTERQVQLWRLEDGPRGGSLYRARLVTRGTVVSVRGDSPEFRAQALRMADGVCELVGFVPEWWSPKTTAKWDPLAGLHVHKHVPTEGELADGGHPVYNPDGTYRIEGADLRKVEERRARAVASRDRAAAVMSTPAPATMQMVHRPPTAG